jgi:hypothetical protein
MTPLIVASRLANCNTSHSIVIGSPSTGGRKYVTFKLLVTPESSHAFLQANVAILVALSKKVAIAPPWVFFVVRLLLHKSGTLIFQTALALLVSDSTLAEARTDWRMKEPSMFSGGMEAA